ncbi:hypothetical protein OIO90_003928 [Microbotryomycetes sp. JL221]|nr:hypothetical protein OIO90_003928 [Microbotryomycetes sp. JL221]
MNKRSNGSNTAMVLRKLHLLTLYLRAVDLGDVVRENYAAFAIVAYTIKASTTLVCQPDDATTMPNVTPVTSLGIEAFNMARRKPKRPLFSRSWSSTSAASSTEGTESSIGSRSRASTLLSNVTTVEDVGGDVDEWDAQERARRVAGTGAASGMGIGLLSAPPRYDGGVAAYVASQQRDTLAFGRSSFEELPSYVRA